jgi:hypothetical protein
MLLSGAMNTAGTRQKTMNNLAGVGVFAGVDNHLAH